MASAFAQLIRRSVHIFIIVLIACVCTETFLKAIFYELEALKVEQNCEIS